MKFDTIIIGGGLAGLLCGIRLAKAGRQCAVISSGQSALHFWSGSFGLLGHLPDGSAVECPLEAVGTLAAQAPEHPYSKIGAQRFGALADEAAALLCESALPVAGDCRRNHFRLTPVGEIKPAWLTIEGYLRMESAESLRMESAALFEPEGFLDFYGSFIADSLARRGVKVERHTFNLPALEALRTNPSEMRPTNVARLFDRTENVDELIKIIDSLAGGAEAVLLPAVLGIEHRDVLARIGQGVGRKVAMVATMPPSVPGISVQMALRRTFERLGGVYMLGDTVVDADVEDNRVKAVRTVNHGDIALLADNFVLATGSFFSRGIVAGRNDVHEPVFGADTVYASERGEWYDRNLFAAQPFAGFGVATDAEFRALKGGRAMANLRVAGAGLAGFNPVKEGSGAGVSALTALCVAENILNERN